MQKRLQVDTKGMFPIGKLDSHTVYMRSSCRFDLFHGRMFVKKNGYTYLLDDNEKLEVKLAN